MDRRDRQRMQVHIVQIRAQDVMPGDIVNRTGPVREGWIEISYTEQLPDGRLNLCDESYRKSFVSEPLDTVWLQIVGTMKGNSHLPVDLPMFYDRVPVQAELPAGAPSAVGSGAPQSR